jgi:hypothetical protein
MIDFLRTACSIFVRMALIGFSGSDGWFADE